MFRLTIISVEKEERMKRLKFSLLLALLMVSFTATAQTKAAEAAKAEIAATAASLTSIQCDFVQTKHLKMLNDKMVSYGRMYYQKSNKLHWEYTKPYAYTLILNGQQVYMKNAKGTTTVNAQSSKLFREIGRIMMNCVMGKSLTNTKDFRVTMTETSGEWAATMVPLRKNMKQMFTKIVLHFNKARKTVAAVDLYEKNGDRTNILLKNVINNKPINAKVFALH